LKIRNGNIRSNEKQSTPKAEEQGNSKRTTHSPSHQAQNTLEHAGVKQRTAWTKEEIRVVMWCYRYCRQHFTENYKKIYELWRQRNPECRMCMDAKKLMNQKNYIMKEKKITEMEVEEIEIELQESQRSHLEETEEEKQENLGIIRDDEQKLNAAFTADEEVEIHQQREQIYK